MKLTNVVEWFKCLKCSVGEEGRGCISRSTIIDKCYSSVLMNDYFCSKFLTSLLFQRIDEMHDTITTYSNKILFKIGVG